MKKHTSAFTGIEVVAALAVLGIATWIFAPSLLPGDSKRAANSTQATAKVEQTANAQGAAAAASVTEIGVANAEAPASPSRDFIAREIPVALSLLPAAGAAKLIEAERRRAAVMEGRADEARRLYEAAAKQSTKLQEERDAALAARRAADLALEKSAAAEHARKLQALGLGAIALIAGAAWVWAKVYHVSPATIGTMIAEMREGRAPVQAITDNLAPRQYAAIERASKLAASKKPDPVIARKE